MLSRLQQPTTVGVCASSAVLRWGCAWLPGLAPERRVARPDTTTKTTHHSQRSYMCARSLVTYVLFDTGRATS